MNDIKGLWRTARKITTNGANRHLANLVGAFEVAMWDAFGKSTGIRVCDLLGGQVREKVPFSAYLFYKYDQHVDAVNDDCWGEVLTPEQLVGEAQKMIDEYGFTAIKLKGGFQDPKADFAGLEALHKAFPTLPLRIDPNGGWAVETALKLLSRLERLVQYIEDPVPGIDKMARVQAEINTPLATNMCIVEAGHLPEGKSKKAVRVILSDHHYWGGLAASRNIARICDIWGIGLSMHSNSHLGISLEGMTHLASATPNLTYDCDTHYPWQVDEVIEGGRLHQNYLEHGSDKRDDATEMRKHNPKWVFQHPRF